jgi:hypothetical protein
MPLSSFPRLFLSFVHFLSPAEFPFLAFSHSKAAFHERWWLCFIQSHTTIRPQKGTHVLT